MALYWYELEKKRTIGEILRNVIEIPLALAHPLLLPLSE
jgi:hypothetical protein